MGLGLLPLHAFALFASVSQPVVLVTVLLAAEVYGLASRAGMDCFFLTADLTFEIQHTFCC